jgi:hypothetical protein
MIARWNRNIMDYIYKLGTLALGRGVSLKKLLAILKHTPKFLWIMVLDFPMVSLDGSTQCSPNPKLGLPGYYGWRLNNEPFRYVSKTTAT